MESLLKQVGLKVTSPRRVVLHYLERQRFPVTAPDIIEALQELDSVTIYRTLQTFERAGIVAVVELGKRARAYELNRDDDHHHITCVVCGHIEDVHVCPLQHVESMVISSSRDFTELASHSLEFRGVCKDCVAKGK